MANTGRSRSGNTSARRTSGTNTKKPARSSSARRTTKKSAPVQQKAPESDSFLKKFASSKAAQPLIFIAAVLLIVGIDLLVSWNKYEMFFKILGVEILIALVAWGVLTLVYAGKKPKSAGAPSEDEV